MRTTSYRQAFRARWVLIVAAGLLVTCLAVLAPPFPRTHDEVSTELEDVASPAQARYQATAAIGVPPISSTGDATVQFKTIAFYLRSTAVGETFAERLGYSGNDFAMLGELIVADADDESGILTVQGYGGTEQQAADITNAFIEALRDYLSGLATQATEQALLQAQRSVDDLQQRIDALGARIAELRASLTDPAQAAEDPQVIQLQAERDALVGSYTAALQNLTRVSTGGAGVSTAGLTVLQMATPATAQEEPPSLLYELWLRVLLGLVVGLGLGAALALLLEHNARKIFGREAAERAFGTRVLVEIPRQRLIGTSNDLVVITAPRSGAAAAYRMLRVLLLSEQPTASGNGAGALAEQTRRPPALPVARAGTASARTQVPTATTSRAGPDRAAVTSEPSTGEQSGNGSSTRWGASADSSVGDVHGVRSRDPVLVIAATANEPAHPSVVANLAASFAESGRTVAVLRMGASARRVGAAAPDEEAPGGSPPTRETSVAGVLVVEWEPRYGGASPAEVVQGLRANGRVVLVDAGHVATAEFAEISSVIDGVVAVCQIGRTAIENAERTADIVTWSHARLLGVVLTQVPAHPVGRVTWSRGHRSPLTSARGLGRLVPWRPGPDGQRRRAGDGEDDELGLLPVEGGQQ